MINSEFCFTKTERLSLRRLHWLKRWAWNLSVTHNILTTSCCNNSTVQWICFYTLSTQARDSVAEKQKAVGEKEMTAQQSSKVMGKPDIKYFTNKILTFRGNAFCREVSDDIFSLYTFCWSWSSVRWCATCLKEYSFLFKGFGQVRESCEKNGSSRYYMQLVVWKVSSVIVGFSWLSAFFCFSHFLKVMSTGNLLKLTTQVNENGWMIWYPLARYVTLCPERPQLTIASRIRLNIFYVDKFL